MKMGGKGFKGEKPTRTTGRRGIPVMKRILFSAPEKGKIGRRETRLRKGAPKGEKRKTELMDPGYSVDHIS